MATLVTHTEDRITFETVAKERQPGLLLCLHGALFGGLPLYVIGMQGISRAPASLIPWLILLPIVGLIEIGFGCRFLLKSERLVIDLPRRSYLGHRGFLPFKERWTGRLEDFDHIQLREIPWFGSGRRGHDRRWVVEWVWCDSTQAPFRDFGSWQSTSCRIAAKPGENDRLRFLRELRMIAEETGLPLAIPRRCLDDLGVTETTLRSQVLSEGSWPSLRD